MNNRTASSSFGARAPFAAGLAVGAALGAGWFLARKLGREQSDQLFDWGQVAAMANRTGGDPGIMTTEQRERIEEGYRDIIREIAEPLGEYTQSGFDLTHTEVLALDRNAWVKANVANFRHLFEPLEASWRETTQPSSNSLPGIAALGRVTVSSELGVLMGYLAKRVLGQYDITLLTQGPAEPGKLYFVEPNVSALQTRLGLPHREFRVWLALHEATHAHEFEGYPWIRPYMDELLREYLRVMADQITKSDISLITGAGGLFDRVLKGDSILEATMNPEQRDLFMKLQALMTMLEGYATHIMNAVGRTMIPHFEQIEDRVEGRQKGRHPLEVLFLRLTGLQLKMDQYRLGAAFIAAVERERGKDFLNQMWQSADQLPTMEEITAPERWIRRIEPVAA